ncbi:PucR family transcriptional regulator [Microbacterium mangrovi]|uniref:PucR family transcriptional regulator n=1 Tax=Microbacterium mangrovi TaxID=1348253 RepID=A0A0B2AEC4_9MICO|nr:helix-turn-helix domain-containing protein [Microbacterium mangrovi]KHL00076.1 PucR family transcriptional regulator [Microbacterium mangrovi]
MVRDVASVARALGGAISPGAVDPAVPVDAVVDLADLTVIGNPMFATLVVCERAGLVAALGDGAAASDLLHATVAVCADDDAALRDALAGAGVTAILGTRDPGILLRPMLDALLAVDAAAEDRRVMTAMRVLTLAARRGGVRGVVAELAHRLDGWVVLLDRHGEMIATSGAGSLHIKDAVASAQGSPVRIRHGALHVHPVGPGEDISARLVVAPRLDAVARGRELGSQAAALLDLLLRTNDTSVTERLGRAAMIDALLGGGPAAAALLREWGVHERTLTGFALEPRSGNVDGERLLKHWLEELGAPYVFATDHGVLHGFLRDDHVDPLAERVQAYPSPLFLGLGTSAAVQTLAGTADEARQALASAEVSGDRVVRYAAIPTVRLVLARLGTQDAASLTRVLDPLRDESGRHGELTNTLRVFLQGNGAWGTAATRLGVHRQTLASRIGRVEELTGLSLADPDDRAAAWLALRALDR